MVMISGFLFVNNIIVKNKLNKAETTIALNLLEKQTLTDSLVNKNKQIVKLQDAVVFEGEKGKKALREYSDSVFNLRKKDERKYKETVAYYQNYISTHLSDTVRIPFEPSGSDSIQKPSVNDERVKEYIDNSIRVPKAFTKADPYFYINGTVSKDGVSINSMILPDTITGRFVERKNGFLKAKTIEYQVFNTNPYIKIDNSKSAIYKPEKKNTFLKIVGIAVLSFFVGKSL